MSMYSLPPEMDFIVYKQKNLKTSAVGEQWEKRIDEIKINNKACLKLISQRP
jgi:hypothetical protein